MGIIYNSLKLYQSSLIWYQLNFNYIQKFYFYTVLPFLPLYVIDVTEYILYVVYLLTSIYNYFYSFVFKSYRKLKVRV